MDRIAGVRSSTRTIETFVNRVSPPTLTVDSYPPSESSFDGSGHVIAHILLHHCGHLTVVHLFTCFHWAINRGGQVDMSESGNSLINLGDWPKPANTLIEKISDAIGGLYRPFQIRRVAQADADADKIRAVAQIEITELQQRAMFRLFAEEGKKQGKHIAKSPAPHAVHDSKQDSEYCIAGFTSSSIPDAVPRQNPVQPQNE